jgi:hypothetical protein
MNDITSVGFSQRIRLEWLEQTATLALAGNSREQIHAVLDQALQGKLSVGSHAEWGNRAKAISILLNVWVSVSDQVQGLRDDGLELMRRLPLQEHFPLHWGMSMAAYPFFGVVAETVGRLLELQGAASPAQVQRRLREQFGQRETVARAARRILRCFVDWGVLQDTPKRGVYEPTPVRPITDPAVSTWLFEATLIAGGSSSRPLEALVQNPALFPFSLTVPDAGLLRAQPRLELSRQGLDVDIVSLYEPDPDHWEPGFIRRRR